MPTPDRSLALELPRTLNFGPGCALQCAQWVVDRGCRSVFLATSAPILALSEPLIAALEAAGSRVVTWSDLTKEPVAADLAAALDVARAAQADVVVALGGGSVMDVAKLVAALLDGAQTLEAVFGIDQRMGAAIRERLDAMGERVDAGGGGHRGRHAERQQRIDEGCVGHQVRADDALL
ncbi:iron-containing alcohol dehydrogenase, partial [bacterium]